MYQDCKTCKDFGNCGCDDLREREYLHREGKDCYKEKKANANNKTTNNAMIYELEDEWERRVSSYRCY